MLCLITGDHEALKSDVRDILVDNGLDCPTSNVVSLDIACDRAGRLSPALVVVVMPSDHELGLSVIRQIDNVLGCQILAIGPADDPKLILRAMQDGADEYLDEKLIDEELSEAIIRFKSRYDDEQSGTEAPGRVISVLAPSGGSGSSTLAANLSAALARQHGSCGLLDLRLAAGDLAPLFDLQPKYTIADLSDNLQRVDQGMFEKCFVKHACGVHLLAAPRDLSQASRITDKVVRQVVSMARRRFNYVIVDLDHTFGEEQIEALWQSEIILIVLRLDYISVRNTRRTLDFLEQAGVGLERVRVVTNRYGERKQLSLRQAEEALAMKTTHAIPDDPSRINTAINAGVPVVLQEPAAKISKRLAALAESVNGAHRASTNGKTKK